MNLPKETAEIFEILSKGYFINYLSPQYRHLYKILDDVENFQHLSAYFAHIHFTLEKESGYFYFSKKIGEGENIADVDYKIDKFSKYIDILDFFACLDHRLEVGMTTTSAEIAFACENDPILQKKLHSTKTSNTNPETNLDKIIYILEDLKKEYFLEKLDKNTDKYLVLDSFHYLQTIISQITPKNYDE